MLNRAFIGMLIATLGMTALGDAWCDEGPFR